MQRAAPPLATSSCMWFVTFSLGRRGGASSPQSALPARHAQCPKVRYLSAQPTMGGDMQRPMRPAWKPMQAADVAGPVCSSPTMGRTCAHLVWPLAVHTPQDGQVSVRLPHLLLLLLLFSGPGLGSRQKYALVGLISGWASLTDQQQRPTSRPHRPRRSPHPPQRLLRDKDGPVPCPPLAVQYGLGR